MSDKQNGGDGTARNEASELRPAAFYDNLKRELAARKWRIRYFSEWLGLGDRLYRWRGTKQPAGLPEAETLIALAVRLEWSLNRLLRGVSAAYDAQADARGETAAPPVTENQKPRLVVAPERRRVVFEGETIEVVRLPEWVAMTFIHGLTTDEVSEIRPLLLDWLNRRETAAGNPPHTQVHKRQTDDPTGTDHPHRRRDD
jgi:hypothetical protein